MLLTVVMQGSRELFRRTSTDIDTAMSLHEQGVNAAVILLDGKAGTLTVSTSRLLYDSEVRLLRDTIVSDPKGESI